MLVGGPGRDAAVMFHENDNVRDVVRVRGGGQDVVQCAGRLDRQDVIFADRSDEIEPGCRSARILVTGRPRYGG
jgi:hypothetical protein